MKLKKGVGKIDLEWFPHDLPKALQDRIGFSGAGWSRNTQALMMKSASLKPFKSEIYDDRKIWMNFTVFTGKGGLAEHRGHVAYISIEKDIPGEPGRDYFVEFHLNTKLSER